MSDHPPLCSENDLFNNAPIKLSDSPTEVTRSPLLGKHTDAVMAVLGYNPECAVGETRQGRAFPSLFLIKPPTSVIGPGESIRHPKDYSGKITYEGELAIVIGKRCSYASVEEANDHIFRFTCINDVTASELLN